MYPVKYLLVTIQIFFALINNSESGTDVSKTKLTDHNISAKTLQHVPIPSAPNHVVNIKQTHTIAHAPVKTPKVSIIQKKISRKGGKKVHKVSSKKKVSQNQAALHSAPKVTIQKVQKHTHRSNPHKVSVSVGTTTVEEPQTKPILNGQHQAKSQTIMNGTHSSKDTPKTRNENPSSKKKPEPPKHSKDVTINVSAKDPPHSRYQSHTKAHPRPKPLIAVSPPEADVSELKAIMEHKKQILQKRITAEPAAIPPEPLETIETQETNDEHPVTSEKITVDEVSAADPIERQTQKDTNENKKLASAVPTIVSVEVNHHEKEERMNAQEIPLKEQGSHEKISKEEENTEKVLVKHQPSEMIKSTTEEELPPQTKAVTEPLLAENPHRKNTITESITNGPKDSEMFNNFQYLQQVNHAGAASNTTDGKSSSFSTVVALGLFTSGMMLAMLGVYLNRHRHGRRRYFGHSLLLSSEDELPILNATTYHDEELGYESWRNVQEESSTPT